jgi:hypothetical protein
MRDNWIKSLNHGQFGFISGESIYHCKEAFLDEPISIFGHIPPLPSPSPPLYSPSRGSSRSEKIFFSIS